MIMVTEKQFKIVTKSTHFIYFVTEEINYLFLCIGHSKKSDIQKFQNLLKQ